MAVVSVRARSPKVRGVRGVSPWLAAVAIGCGASTPGPGPTPIASQTPGATATTGACGGLELDPINRHYFRDVASGQPVLIVGYRNLAPEYAQFIPAAPPGQPQPPGAGTLDPWYTDYAIDDMTGQADPFPFPSFKRHYATVFHLGSGDDPLVDPMYDNGSGTNAAPGFYAWPWLRSQAAGGACYGAFGDPNGTRYDVGGRSACPAAWNTAYLDRLGAAVSRASASCITSEVKLFDKSMLQDHWRDVPWASDNSSNALELPACTQPGAWPQFFYLQQSAPALRLSQQCYVDKIVDVTVASTNVVYEIENENFTSGTEAWAHTWAMRIKGRTAHLVSYSSAWDDNPERGARRHEHRHRESPLRSAARRGSRPAAGLHHRELEDRRVEHPRRRRSGQAGERRRVRQVP